MLKKILLFLLAVVVAVPAAGLSYLYLRKPVQAPPLSIKVSMAPDRIARGRFLFTAVADCDGCHSERDFTRFGGPVVESGRGRGVVMSDVEPSLPGIVVAPNVTPDPETGIGAWTDGEKIRAIREGVSRDGRALFPMMPYANYRHMCDSDVQALVAFLNSLPPVRNRLPKTKLRFPVSLMIRLAPQPAGSVAPPGTGDRLKHGEYLATLASCRDCHTPVEEDRPVPGRDFAGGQRFVTTYGTVLTANITPDSETGIGKWSEEHFLKKFYDYKEYAEGAAPRIAGPDAFTVMPWLAFSRLPPEDLGAIYAWLRTVPAVYNAVETHPGAPKEDAP